ncbi:MAG TPA: hypothetical protein PKA06_00365 [Gemmatales bacterium]|nr:hypothetical protein [Gemmatales bacterium]HMP15393.1 hypothetical protein [Gemmatales bacterium]
MPSPSVQRGKWLILLAVSLLILERLVITGYALAAINKSQINWTAVLLPLTHIAVVIFLLITVDMLIYWLVIMWSVIVSGIYVYKFWLMFTWDSLTLKHGLPGWWLIVSLMVFHIFIGLVLLTPSVRAYLAQQRSKLDFMESSEPPASTN